jgi:hypothetical protein
MRRNIFAEVLFYFFAAIAVCTLLAWFAIGVRQGVDAFVNQFLPYLQESQFGLPQIVVDIVQFIAVILLGVLLGLLVIEWILPPLLAKYFKPGGEYFDPETSVLTKINRDSDQITESLMKAVFLATFILSFWLLENNYSTMYAWGVTVVLSLYIGFQLMLVYWGIKDTEVTTSYYFKSKPAYDAYIERMRDGWTEKAQSLFELVDPESSDYPVIAKMRAKSLNEKAADSFEYSYIAGSDPSIHYGPYTPEDLQTFDDEHTEYEESEMRVG